MLTTQEKAIVLQALSDEMTLQMSCDYKWFVSFPDVQISDGWTDYSDTGGWFNTPNEAIEACFERFTNLPKNKFIKIYKEDSHKVKWNGFMWRKVLS
jgi:hypothetical protein